MDRNEFFPSSDGGKFASKAYWNALRKLQAAARDAFGEELEAHGTRGMECFESALNSLKDRLKRDPIHTQNLLEKLDIQPGEDIREVLLGSANMDDLTPTTVTSTMYAEFHKRGRGRFELRSVLRSVLDELFKDAQTRRPRVGPNRHWPRLLQYLREIEEETDWTPDGRGIRLANKGGRGPIARDPQDPNLLSIIIDPDFL